jgi:hypothetical protein
VWPAATADPARGRQWRQKGNTGGLRAIRSIPAWSQPERAPLFALLAELSATADWRCIAEEIWPFVQAAPCTPMGTAEATWLAGRRDLAQAARAVR